MQRRGGGPGLGAVLFTDIVGSTAIAAEMGDARWSELVARHHRIVRRELTRLRGHEVDTAGDGFFATFDRPADAIRCAVAATEAVRELGIEIRAGVAFGELESVGKKASGLVVNMAARVMSVAGPGEVLVPASVREIVPGGGIAFTDHGVRELKGLEGEFRLFKVTEVDGVVPAPPLDLEEGADRRREIFPTESRRRALLMGVGAGVLALIVVGVLLATGGEEPRASPGPLQDSVAPFDGERGQFGARVSLGATGGRTEEFLPYTDQPMAAGEGGVWVLRQPFLVHVDPLHDEVRSSVFDVGFDDSQSVDTGFGSVWVMSGNTVFKVHPATDEASPFVVLPTALGIVTWSFTLGDAIWFAESDGTLVRLDPLTGARDQTETGFSIDQMATTRDALWASDALASELIELDPSSFDVRGRPIEIAGNIDRLAARGDHVWILDRIVGVVTRMNALNRSVSQTARVGDDPTGMAVGRDAVWVGDAEGALYRVDASTLQVERFPVGFEVLGVDVDDTNDEVWLYLGDRLEPDAG
ncbi:MAG TPA: adenylate/guanylate cyclase domain-containing protein [Actinomycetota bacterium]|nr:adenylate/guanylate cyclase domain-containing protein [Actinomycetota bacterium]